MSAAELLIGFSHRGIQLKAEGERLSYDAPAGHLQASDLEKLRSHKSELLAYLSREAANTIADPSGSCTACESGQWWQIPGRPWYCRRCKPAMPCEAATLTLPCHKEQPQPVAAHAGIRTLFENACQRLSITPKQLRQELREGNDLPDLVSGVLTPKALRLTAKTLALMRYSYPPELRIRGTSTARDAGAL
jgi:TubC N-terminal docking domain